MSEPWANKQAKVLPTFTPDQWETAVTQAVRELRLGQLVALPTETVYGLASNAFNAEAVGRIFAVKGRPANNPIIVHVASLEMAKTCAREWPETADKLARVFWPGPLTLILQKTDLVPEAVTAGGATVALRWPKHPVMVEIIRRCGFPLAAPSANPSGQISPTRAAHVLQGLGRQISLIVDGGPTQVGIESTVVDLSGAVPGILRPGMIHKEQLEAILGPMELSDPSVFHQNQAVLPSPGMLAKHYAPRAKLVIWSWETEEALLRKIQNLGIPVAAIHVFAHRHIPGSTGFGRVCVFPMEPREVARHIFAEMHASDEARAQIIVVERFPNTPPWHGINDRLFRASQP